MQKQYRIPGINKFESSCIIELSGRPEGKPHDSLLKKLTDYLHFIQQTMSAREISVTDLTPRNQAAFFTLKGILDHFTGVSSRHAKIYQQCHHAFLEFSRFHKYSLIIRYQASSRLYHSIRLRNNNLILNLSLGSLSLPDKYFYFLSSILLARLAGKKPDPPWLEHIREFELPFLNTPSPGKSATSKFTLNPHGNYYNLQMVFQDLNREYFQNRLSHIRIGWSLRRNRRRLGSYSSRELSIKISRILDHQQVPEFVIRGIVYHEMLHVIHPIQQKNGRRIIHGRDFKKDEKKFNEHLQLNQWLKYQYPKMPGTARKSGRLKKIFF